MENLANSNSPQLSVQVINAGKNYESSDGIFVNIFSNVNLLIPEGTIYGLLGPSGCGKTSLLRCILGRLKLDKGSILVFGHRPGTRLSGIPGPAVGYMAQETTVYLTMTIGEFLHYFGSILGMSSDKIKSQTEYFIKLLKLPAKNTLASNLSGGQLRRVQFAAALIHDPKLLVLDEPTVGIDPLTKKCMWDHLMGLTKINGTSIIITTHYIEEARLAHRVGLIHGCTMAAEDTTENLLRKYNETTLEEVFLKICYRDRSEAVTVNNNEQFNLENGLSLCESGSLINAAEYPTLNSSISEDCSETSQSGNCLERCLSRSPICWYRVYAVIVRIIINLYRFPGLVLMLALVPVSQVLLFTHTMGNAIGGIQMTIINEDVGQFGSQYLTFLNPDIIVQKHFEKYEVGLHSVKNGESYGLLHIKSNFSSVIHERFTDFALASDEIIKAGTIEVQMDNTNLNIAKSAEYHLMDAFQHFVYDSLRGVGINPLVSHLPINVSQKTMELLTQPGNVYVLPGELVMSSYYCALPVAVLTLFMEKHKGYLEPNFLAGVTSVEMLLGIIITQLGILVMQNIGIVLAALPVLSGVNKGSVFLIFCILYVQGLGGTSLGIFLSLLCDNPITLFSLTISYLFASAAISGLMWPVEAQPIVFRYLSWSLPLAQPGKAIQVIIHRGWDLYFTDVLSAFGISFIWIIIYIILSLLLLRMRK